MPDLKTGLLTYPEFLEAIEGRTGTVFLFDIKGQGAGSLQGAKETGDWQFGDWQLVTLAEHMDGEDHLARVGGDLFALFTEGNEVEVDAIQKHLNLSPVKVHWGCGPTVIAADQDMHRRRHKNRLMRTGIKHGNG
jgi:GGDEF domain-containing protein